MVKVLILGCTGMLGSMVLDYLSTKDLELTATLREKNLLYKSSRKYTNVKFLLTTSLDTIDFTPYDYIINCIGVIKQKPSSVEESIRVNAVFPHTIKTKAKVIQIATDCVFSGKEGSYTEESKHDALDVYGKTKSLGEVPSFYNIRTSIIGSSPYSKVSLLDWFLSQKKNAIVEGYLNHWWNGITTLHFAKLCYAIIQKERIIPNILHFIPEDYSSKCRLLRIFAESFNREDIIIECVDEVVTDRRLSTKYPLLNHTLWKDMGYARALDTETMFREFAAYIKERNFYE